MENAKKVFELNEKSSSKNASLEKVQVVELGSASELILGNGNKKSEQNRPTWPFN